MPDVPHRDLLRRGDNVHVIWEDIPKNSTGAPVELMDFPDKTIQCYGTFGTSVVVTVQGSNDPRVETNPGSAVWFTLTDYAGNPLTFEAAGAKVPRHNTRYMRPAVSDHATPAITVAIAASR
jgi:hypothetical protein